MNSRDDGFSRVRNALLAHPNGTATQLSEEAQVSQSTASRYLNAMAHAGLALKKREGQQTRFAPQPWLAIRWTGQPGTIRHRARHEEPWLHLAWEAQHPVDWRFPLASQVRDDMGRLTTERLLEHLWHRGLFTPWLTMGNSLVEALHDSEHASTSDPKALDLLTTPEPWDDTYVVVYGSCARGDARRDSDLDVAVIGQGTETWEIFWKHRNVDMPIPDQRQQIQRAVDEVNKGAPRFIDLVYVETSEFFDLPPPVLNGITESGITVFASCRRPFLVEALREHRD